MKPTPPGRTGIRPLALGLALTLGAGTALAGEPTAPEPATASAPPPSWHAAESARHAAEPLRPRIPPRSLPTTLASNLERVVYGYYPYWVTDLSTIRWSALTHLAWFSLDLDASGNVTAHHGWPDTATVTAAHDAGVRVDLTFTLFSGSGIQALCSSPANRATTIANMLAELEAGGADGISVDFEFVNSATRDDFTTFVTELRAALDAGGHADAEISIAAPTENYGNALDVPALLDQADWFFLMGYGYFWGGSSHAGPAGLLRVTPDWAPYSSLSMVRSIASYSKLIPAAKRRQLVWGVPYYGREWVTATGELGAATVDSLGAVTYSASVGDLASGNVEKLWDDGIKNPWYRWQSAGAWHEVYYDDAESLAAKYGLALAEDLGGVGMWALNYDAPHTELWDLLETSFTNLPAPAEGHRSHPIAIPSFPFQDARDTTVGPSQYFNYYSCAPSTPEYGREWVYRLDVCQPGTLVAKVPSYADRDPDLHLLSAPDQDACLARDDTELSASVTPGQYLLVVDTYVQMPIELEGAYELDVDFTPEPGSVGCAPYLACLAGACVCATAGELDCGAGCVDPATDREHCGSCGVACGIGAACVGGECAPAPLHAGGALPPSASGGCACRLAPASARGVGSEDAAALGLLGLAGLLRARRTWGARRRG